LSQSVPPPPLPCQGIRAGARWGIGVGVACGARLSGARDAVAKTVTGRS